MLNRRTLNLSLLLYSAAGLIASSFIHFYLYFGFNLAELSPPLWTVMHVSIIGGWVGIYFLQKSGVRYLVDFSKERSPVLLTAMTVLFAFFLFYALINFFYHEEALRYGHPDIVNGQQILVLPRGQMPHLTPEEYASAKLYQARKNSGHWMLFHLVPCMMLYMNHKWAEYE